MCNSLNCVSKKIKLQERQTRNQFDSQSVVIRNKTSSPEDFCNRMQVLLAASLQGGIKHEAKGLQFKHMIITKPQDPLHRNSNKQQTIKNKASNLVECDFCVHTTPVQQWCAKQAMNVYCLHDLCRPQDTCIVCKYTGEAYS